MPYGLPSRFTALQALQLRRERYHHLEHGVEREERRLITVAEVAKRNLDRASRAMDIATNRHAPADIEHDAEARRRIAYPKIVDAAPLPRVEDLKLGLRQVLDNSPAVVPYGDGDRDSLGGGAKRRRSLRVLGR